MVPQDIPGMSLSERICLSWRPRRAAAGLVLWLGVPILSCGWIVYASCRNDEIEVDSVGLVDSRMVGAGGERRNHVTTVKCAT